MVTQFPTSSAAPAQPYENEPEPVAAATVDLKPEEVHADQAEEASADTATGPSADEVETASADRAEQVPAYQSEDVSAVDAAEVPADQAADVPEQHTQELPVVRAEEVTPGETPEVPVDHADQLPRDGAKDQSPVNHANGEQRQELEPQPLTEYTAEPDSARVNHESMPDGDLWPLLDHQRELDAEVAAKDHTRDRQPTH